MTRWLVVVGFVLVVGLGVWLVTHGPWASGGLDGPKRLAYGAVALSAEEALVAGRGDGETGPRFFLELVTRDGGRWDVETTPLKVETTLGLMSLAHDAERIYALLMEDQPGLGGELVAFSREDGKRLWTSPLPKLPKDTPRRHYRKLPLTQSILVQGGVVYALVQDVAAGLVAVDAQSGAPKWKLGLGVAAGRPDAEMARAFEVGTKKVAILARGLTLIDRETGAEERPIEAFGAVCRAGGKLLMRQREGLAEVSLDGGELARFPIEDAVPWVESCAATRDGWVLAGMKGGVLTMQRVAREGDALVLRWESALPGSGFSMLGGPSNGAAQAHGELGNRWPVVVYATNEKGGQVDRLVVVDLESGKIVSAREGQGGGIRLGERFAAGARLGSVTLIGADASELATYIAPGVEVVDSLVAGNHLWLISGAEAVGPGAHARTVVDLVSGAVVGGVGPAATRDTRGLSAAFPVVLPAE